MVELPDLLVEVDGWTDFKTHFQHAAGSTTRGADRKINLNAAILAQAPNLGLSTMADLAGLSETCDLVCQLVPLYPTSFTYRDSAGRY